MAGIEWGESGGDVWLYDPDLQMVRTWKVQSLGCIEHKANDGLMARGVGIQHGILVSVPASLMQKAGNYHFVLHFIDNHLDKYKDHKEKPALEVNVKIDVIFVRWVKWEALFNEQSELIGGKLEPDQPTYLHTLEGGRPIIQNLLRHRLFTLMLLS